VPTPAGGGTDIIGRIAGDYFTRTLGKAVVIENQGGAGGQIGSQAVARSDPDGYTLLLAFVSTHGTLPAIRKLPYDPMRSFTPIAMIGGAPNVLVCRQQGGPADFGAFLAECRAKPAKYSFGSGGPGTITHLVFEHLKLAAHLDRGQVQYAMPGLAGAVQHIKAGRLRALAVTGPRRHSLLPDVPTLGELGLGEFDAVQWVGLMGPAKLPQAVTVRLHETTQRMLLASDIKEKLAKDGVDAMPMSTAAFAQYVEKDLAVWRRVVKDSGIKMEA
jgi:tripartite-type tricarboxylate transporter receptor subunit TctC